MRSPPASRLLVLAARRHRARLDRALADFGLSAGQEAMLREAAATDGVPLSELAARLDVEPPTVTNMAGRLERAGFVRRELDPADARVRRLHLTAEGRGAQREVERRCRAVESETVSALSSEERAELSRLLGKLAGRRA
jgi:DNA-binding MarR family transcriptional regulator